MTTRGGEWTYGETRPFVPFSLSILSLSLLRAVQMGRGEAGIDWRGHHHSRPVSSRLEPVAPLVLSIFRELLWAFTWPAGRNWHCCLRRSAADSYFYYPSQYLCHPGHLAHGSMHCTTSKARSEKRPGHGLNEQAVHAKTTQRSLSLGQAKQRGLDLGLVLKHRVLLGRCSMHIT